MLDKITILNSLVSIYDDILKGGINFSYENISDKLTELNINQIVKYYTIKNGIFDDTDIEIISYIIKCLQSIYNNSSVFPPISDDDYDKLYEVYLDTSSSDIVGAEVANSGLKTIGFHKYPDLRGTLDKIHFIRESDKSETEKRKSLEGWFKSIENKLGRKLELSETSLVLYPKFDGVSVIKELNPDGSINRLLTRGDVTLNEAVDITFLFKDLPKSSLHFNVPFGEKTEVIMTSENFELFQKDYGKFKNRRSAVSSIINSLDVDPENIKYLTMVHLRYQVEGDSNIYMHPEADKVRVIINDANCESGYNKIETGFEIIRTIMEDKGIPIDGVVISLIDDKLKKTLGREDAITKYEVAYKFPAESARSHLLDVRFSVGVLGTITPVAIIEPVVLNGNTIDSPSLGSIDRFKSLGLRKGDEVIIRYDIIPYLSIDETCDRSNNPIIEIPQNCEYCNEKLVYDPVLKCVNSNCPSRKIGKLVNYITKMSIPDISIGIVTTLFNKGYIDTIPDLYELYKYSDEIKDIPGFGKKSVKKIINGINSRYKVYDYQVLASLGIPDIGLKIFKNILDIYYLDSLIDISIKNNISKLTELRGIKETTALKIINGINSNIDIINYLKNKLMIEHDERRYEFVVAFTKVRDKNFEKFLDTKNVLVLDSYNKKVDILIVPDMNTDSNKVEKAIKDEKKIMSLDEAKKLFGYID